MRCGYVVVEGPHDVELVYRLLSPYGLKRVRYLSDLDPLFAPLVPRDYPPDDDLQKRMPVPLFLQSGTDAIAVHSAFGDSRLIEIVEENAAMLGRGAMSGVGLLLDADRQTSATRYAKLRSDMAAKGFALDPIPGQVAPGKPRLGAFVLPDNRTTGTLEDLLLESAQAIYPALLASAQEHVDRAAQDSGLTRNDLADFKQPAGRNKAIIHRAPRRNRPLVDGAEATGRRSLENRRLGRQDRL
ncbi:DUF3226 domain-containing protein [uncultured Thiodictyon sp.]|uniref:DUF3226 domain-containing protein n=1 Tax=uncultured Thiodictyon sp. TaxID=1846217 RepID=UPI0025CC1573|nr:DUF3226 domain-containing protein [uncultured Thiodictyon sp.]